MENSIDLTEQQFELRLEGELRTIILTWVKINPACRVVPNVPLDFYIIKTKNEKEDWILL